MDNTKKEVAFIDPGISDLDAFLAGLRPEIEATVLDPALQGPAQIADALKGRSKLSAIHIVAHGRPGEVSFGAGALSADNILEHAADLAEIGRTIADGNIQLWTCETAQGERGVAFVEALARITGANVAASSCRIGAADKGGRWELDVLSTNIDPRVPLKAEAIENYRGIMSAPTNLILNGNFETGDFSDWTLGGNSSGLFITGTSTNPGYVPIDQGSYSAAFGSLSADGSISQAFATTAGQEYKITFDLSNPANPYGNVDPSLLNDFVVKLNGVSEFGMSTKFNFNYITVSFNYLATTTGFTSLEFDGYNNENAWGLDNVSAVTICFMSGTKISTPFGEIEVQTLKRGDLVLTTKGQVAPVSWLGRQTVSTRFADPLRVFPIRIKAGALAENVPSRDLLLSPDHAVLVDGALIQAGALVNGTSIVRERDVPKTFTYYHVELDDHSLILAENTPAETFVDNVDRMNFDNWAEHQALYPEGKTVEELPYPRAKAHRQVPVATRVKLGERAQAIGATVGVAAA